MLRTPPLHLCVALFAVVALDVGCVLASPDFDGGSEATTATGASDSDPATSAVETTGASMSGSASGHSDSDVSGSASQGSTSGTSDATTTGAPTTGEPTTGEATTGEPTTGEPTTTGEATTGGMTTGDQTTGGVEPGTYDLNPSVAACVLQGNQNGPYTKQGCAMNASAQVGEPGLLMHDTAVGNAGGVGRRAESYLSFAIPGEWAGAMISAAKVRVQSANTPWVDTPKAGELVETQSFTEGSLDASSPGVLGSLAVNDTQLDDSDWVEWAVPPELLIPGEGLFLGIMPTDSIGVFLRENTAQLEVVIE